MMMGWGFIWIILLIVVIYFLFQQQQRSAETTYTRSAPRYEDPLEVLQRRYAAGEISTEEYEERRRVLERDRQGF